MGRQIANVIAFLTSAEASAMTGSDVLVDCGMRNILPTTSWDGKIKVPETVKATMPGRLALAALNRGPRRDISPPTLSAHK
jgi:hypothetical protein